MSPGVDDPLAVGDALAADVLAELEPLRFLEAVDDREREEAFRLRYRAVVERDMVPAERFENRLEHDSFDPAAVQILGWDAARPIATCRLVLPVPGRPLPMEASFGRVTRPEDTVEWGRVVVDPDYRGDGHSVFMGLAARGWLAMRARGFTTAVGVTPPRLVRLFRALGFAVTILGPPRRYWGEERYPILCEGRAAARGVERLWTNPAAANPRADQVNPSGDHTGWELSPP